MSDELWFTQFFSVSYKFKSTIMNVIDNTIEKNFSLAAS